MKINGSKTALFALGAGLVSMAGALAMQPAQTKAGYDAGAELGAQFNGGTSLAGAADFGYGFKTNFLQSPYTEGVIDYFTTAKKVVGHEARAHLITVGLRQPLPIGGSTPIAVEGGLSYLSTSFAGGTASTTSGFLGARATFAQSSSIAINAMGRYHFENSGFYQLGAGLTGPVGKGSGLFYQADYYHTGGSGSSNTDTVLVGVRWSGNF